MTKKVILVGKSCSGKTTLKDYVVSKCGLKPDVSYTTRPIREGEQDGVDYHFITEEGFVRDIQEGEFLQYDHFNGRYYGTHMSEFRSKDVFIMTPDGIAAIDPALRKSCKIIYLNVPMEVIGKRMQERGDMDQEAIYRRMSADNKEFGEFDDFDLCINTDLTLIELTKIVLMERSGNINMWYLLSEYGSYPYCVIMKDLDLETGDFVAEVYKQTGDGSSNGLTLQQTHKFNAKDEKATMMTVFNKKWEEDTSVNIAAYMAFVGQFFAHTTNPVFAREDLLYCSMGLGEEAGEVMSLIRKKNWYDKEFTREDMLEELGDVMWYATNLIRFAGFTMSEVLTFNKHKIEKRYGTEGIFDAQKAREKDTQVELATAAAKLKEQKA